jgi:capsular polysaccharide biosynthesis protein
MKALNLVLGLLLGVISGMGLAFFTEYFRRTIRTAQDVTVQLRLPVLGMIPKKP